MTRNEVGMGFNEMDVREKPIPSRTTSLSHLAEPRLIGDYPHLCDHAGILSF